MSQINIKENATTVELKYLKMPLSALVVEHAGEAPPAELDNKSMTKGKRL
ncbi:hypothetical protein NBRC116591_17290 [Sessilibacter corallicola]|uniref:Uncharacterized protein n=1 Tax=Sessilibacter corallicola TaxID=2904075 RepID=A0ABQ0A8N9_9GAMM